MHHSLFHQFGVMLGLSVLALPIGIAGEVAPEKQAEFHEIEQLIDRLEHHFYSKLAAQDGVLYAYTNDLGQAKKLRLDYAQQEMAIPDIGLADAQGPSNESNDETEAPKITDEEIAAVVSPVLWAKYLALPQKRDDYIQNYKQWRNHLDDPQVKAKFEEGKAALSNFYYAKDVVQDLYRFKLLTDFIKTVSLPEFVADAKPLNYGTPYDEKDDAEKLQALKNDYPMAVRAIQKFSYQAVEELALEDAWAEAKVQADQLKDEIRNQTNNLYNSVYANFSEDAWQTLLVSRFGSVVSGIMDNGYPTQALAQWPSYLRENLHLQQREQQAELIKQYLVQDIQQVREKLYQIIKAQDNGQNHQAVEHLLEQLYAVDENNLLLVGSASEAEGRFNARNVIEEKRIELTRGLVLDYPRTIIRLVMAHELGHSVGLDAFTGNAFTGDACRVTWVPRSPRENENEEERQAEYCRIRAQQKAYAPFRVDQHPFKAVLAEYVKYGINGLDYFDPAKVKAVKAEACAIYERIKHDEDLKLWYNVGKNFALPWEKEDYERAKALDDLFWINFFSKYEMFCQQREREKAAVAENADSHQIPAMGEDTSPLIATEVADDAENNKLDEKYAQRAEEVLADHFSKLILEEEIKAAHDPAQKQQLALAGVLRFIAMPTLETALKYECLYPGIISPRYAKFKQAQQDNPEQYRNEDIRSSDFKSDVHPSTRERLVILLSSPIIRDALSAI